MQITVDDFPVARIGEPPDVGGRLTALDGGSDPVEPAEQAAHRH